MPTRPKRPCKKPGCPKLTDSGWCEDHARARPPEQKPWGTTTTSAHARGYGAHWRKLRALVLARQPLCSSCQRRASTQVDHIVPKAAGGTDEEHNLRGVCGDCHAAKTAREGTQGRRRRS